MSIAIIYGGTRQNGNTEILTEKAVQGITAEKIYLKDFKIQSIEDLRHEEGGVHTIHDEHNLVIERMMPHDILVFATPIYWYSMSGIMKNFIDRWSQTLRDKKYPDFKHSMANKKAYVIAVGGDYPNIKGLPLIQQFHYIFDFVGISFEGYIIGRGNKPGDVYNDKEALLAANELQKKLILEINK
ncbi:flavodoxin family protein [Caldifermentibacillus hisashii]|uniref:flavodoxin family protein n=1 Tax=Caldifermentibacillus hisashii TaxID=996558 RepID=UPI003D1B28C6